MLQEQYAAALYELTIDNISSIKENFDDFFELLKGNNELLLFLKSPIISKIEKKEVIDKIPFEEVFIHFLDVLVDNGRMDIIFDIYTIFNKLIAEGKGIYVIDAISAKALTKSEIDSLKKNLHERFKGEIVINNLVDPNTIGGLRLEHNGESIDQSFKGQMMNLKSTL